MAVSSSLPIAKSGRNKKIAIKSQKSYKKICKFQKICLTLHPEINNKPTKNKNKMKTNDTFSADMDKIFSIVNERVGGKEIQESMFAYFDADLVNMDSEDYHDWEIKYNQSKSGIYCVLASMVNFDMISVADGMINIECSNMPEVAKIMKKYASDEQVKRIYEEYCF